MEPGLARRPELSWWDLSAQEVGSGLSVNEVRVGGGSWRGQGHMGRLSLSRALTSGKEVGVGFWSCRWGEPWRRGPGLREVGAAAQADPDCG